MSPSFNGIYNIYIIFNSLQMFCEEIYIFLMYVEVIKYHFKSPLVSLKKRGNEKTKVVAIESDDADLNLSKNRLSITFTELNI
jgi:hypothetical protein